MRIGAICRMDNSGLGIQSREFFNHIPCKALVIDSTNFKGAGVIQHPEWYPGQTFLKIDRTLKIPPSIISEFIKDIDTLITFETPYDYEIFNACRRRRVRTILQPNYEFLEYPSNHPLPDLFAAPSMWNYSNIPDPKVFLPVPVNTKLFSFERKPHTFIHVVGKPAVFDRNGTQCFLNCLRYVKTPINVIVNTTTRIKIDRIPSYVCFSVDDRHTENYWDNYTGGVLVMPRKYGGLCLPFNEAIAAEMPIITTDISPNNQWLPQEWLVPARNSGSFMCKHNIDYYDVDLMRLAKKIDEFFDPTFYNEAVEKAKELKSKISWEALLPLYKEVLGF